eukprot:CAMPEP_0206570710 /NCGR_PEP_ID=MMETSP0325_2-20121206/27198_1 /ASSEMBLY_ACC=CAM_ASM_000347 /TAXON_ID=2866 /ORGANISM="Crypthecodinium cohnii, Strain Seligo" /LENGTH=168 /DNA_ID=CAMNT_0054074547 /DNA_START=1721 /DNA_END=2227 /DNA_ORIENTATION=-
MDVRAPSFPVGPPSATAHQPKTLSNSAVISSRALRLPLWDGILILGAAFFGSGVHHRSSATSSFATALLGSWAAPFASAAAAAAVAAVELPVAAVAVEVAVEVAVAGAGYKVVRLPLFAAAHERLQAIDAAPDFVQLPLGDDVAGVWTMPLTCVGLTGHTPASGVVLL